MKKLSKNYLRKTMFSFFEFLPSFLAKPAARLLVYTQHRVFIEELQAISKDFPCIQENDVKTWQRILVIRLDSIGDITWTTAFFRELRADFPEAEIDAVLRPIAKVMMENCPYINKIYAYDCAIGQDDNPKDFPQLREKARSFMETITKGQGNTYDAVFLPREVFLGDGIEALYLAAYSRAVVRIGRHYATNPIEKARCAYIEPFFSFFARMEQPKHQVLQILDELKILSGRIYPDNMELWLSHEEHQYFERWLEEHENHKNARLVMVGLEGSTQNRSWLIDNYVKVFEQEMELFPKELCFVLLADREIRNAEKNSLEHLDNVIDMSGRTTLREVVALIAHSTVYLGSDTGLMHIAAAFGKPVVELSAHFKDGRVMDSGSPILVGPFGVENIVLEPETGLDDCVGWCTKSYPHCIRQIRPVEVGNALRKILNNMEKKNG